jgi:hypothetical protein
MAAQRLDILEQCWEKTPIGVIVEHFWDELEKLPDSKLRDGMVLIILKSPTTNTRYQDDAFSSYSGFRKEFAKKLLTMAQKSLPDVPLEYDSISTYEKRLVLARAMEKALGIESETPENAKRVWPPKPGNKPGAPSTPSPQDGAANNPNRPVPLATVDKTGEPAPLPGGWALWAGIAAILASAAGWLLLRSKRKKG